MTPSRASLTLLISLVLSTIGPKFCEAQYEGDACNIEDSKGVCTLLQNCPSIWKQLLQGSPPRSICGYSNFDPVVCCPRSDAATSTTTTIRTTTTTTTTTTRTPVPTDDTFPPKQGEFGDDGRGFKARQKCAEYASAVYTTEIPPTLLANKVPVNVSLCAIKGHKLIVGGKKADPKEFPHMAAVGFGSDKRNIVWNCGGTLISERFVLTAAHCTFSAEFGSATWVRLGDLNLERSDDDAKPQDIRIQEKIRHPGYRRPSVYHDIALLRLEKTVTFNAWVRPCCLPYSLPDTGTDDKATATGWGAVEWAGDTSSDLLKVTISLMTTSVCNRTFIGNQEDSRLRFGIVGEWQICAGEFGKDTCQGDSGGPLVILSRDYNCMYTVVGVTSLGKLCGSIAPGIYTRVYNYIPWIESIVWPDS